MDEPFTVVVADNFDYMAGPGHVLGSFATLELAIAACRRVVDKYLTAAFTPGMLADDLYRSYTTFGADPYILGPRVTGVPFSAWEYARARCDELCGRAS